MIACLKGLDVKKICFGRPAGFGDGAPFLNLPLSVRTILSALGFLPLGGDLARAGAGCAAEGPAIPRGFSCLSGISC